MQEGARMPKKPLRRHLEAFILSSWKDLQLYRICLFFLVPWLAAGQQKRDLQIPRPVTEGSVLVFGFLGGFEHWNDSHRGIRQVALDLRSLSVPKLYVETIENHRRKLAVQTIRESLSSSGNLKRPTSIILYGQSWGGAAVIKTARDLQKLGIPVLLTVQIDSVGLHDDIVPSNVRMAANIFQHDLLSIGGQQQIQAEDPFSTQILENIQLSYLFRPYSTLHRDDTTWVRRNWGGSHAKMEADGIVWEHVEDLILRAIQN